MTSHELAKRLLAMPDLMVTVNGYEGGVNEVSSITEPQKLAVNVPENEAWYYGKHEYKREFEGNEIVVMAIHLSQ